MAHAADLTNVKNTLRGMGIEAKTSWDGSVLVITVPKEMEPEKERDFVSFRKALDAVNYLFKVEYE